MMKVTVLYSVSGTHKVKAKSFWFFLFWLVWNWHNGYLQWIYVEFPFSYIDMPICFGLCWTMAAELPRGCRLRAEHNFLKIKKVCLVDLLPKSTSPAARYFFYIYPHMFLSPSSPSIWSPFPFFLCTSFCGVFHFWAFPFVCSSSFRFFGHPCLEPSQHHHWVFLWLLVLWEKFSALFNVGH